jgi:glycosyltransferase involved in cell wall biosynthesis
MTCRAATRQNSLSVPAMKPRIAVILPCYNEERTIGATITAFRTHLPGAEIWVCDNRSSDQTADQARAYGARVVSEPIPGKGNAVRRLFAEVDADVFVMSDGDTTYDASAAPALVERLIEGHYDMVVGRRVSQDPEAYRRGHRLGNQLFSRVASFMFGFQIADIFSGYRIFSRRFVKTFPATSERFEIESELNVHAIDQRLPTCEIDTIYASRPEGSQSKLSTYRDGFRILIALLRLFRDVRPFQFFGLLALTLLISAIVLSVPLFYSYVTEGIVPRLPTAILVTGLAVVAFIFFVTGIILDALRLSRHNHFRAAYLAQDTSYFSSTGPAALRAPTFGSPASVSDVVRKA